MPVTTYWLKLLSARFISLDSTLNGSLVEEKISLLFKKQRDILQGVSELFPGKDKV